MANGHSTQVFCLAADYYRYGRSTMITLGDASSVASAANGFSVAVAKSANKQHEQVVSTILQGLEQGVNQPRQGFATGGALNVSA